MAGDGWDGGEASPPGWSLQTDDHIVQMNFWSRLLFSPHKHYLVQTAGPMFDPLSLCPPGSAMTSLQQYGKENSLEWKQPQIKFFKSGDGAHLLQQSAMLFTITKIEEAITTEKHRVKYDRTRLILQETEGGMLTRCWD